MTVGFTSAHNKWKRIFAHRTKVPEDASMPRKYGITNNPSRRRMELKQEYFGLKHFRVEKEFPNQEEAQEWESKQPDTHPGGPKIRGPFYGYSYHYKQKR